MDVAGDLCAKWLMDTHGPTPTRRAVLTTAAATTMLALTGAAASSASATGRKPTSPGTVALPDGIRPEGITSGPGSTYYVGSLADGRIVTGDLKRGTVKVLLAGATGRSLRGLYWDRRTGLVWAAGNVGDIAHVWAVDGRSGAVVSDTVVPGGAFLNDLVVGRDTVWVTDSRVDRLTAIAVDHRGRPTGAAPRFVPLSGAWPTYDGSNINANGIRQLSDGSLVLNNSQVGGLWNVSRKTGVTTQIPVSGGPGITSGDGLELDGSVLYNVRGTGGSSVAVLRLSRPRSGWRATWVGELTDPTLDVPSTATVAAGSLWAVNARFGVASPDTAPYWITRLPSRAGVGGRGDDHGRDHEGDHDDRDDRDD